MTHITRTDNLDSICRGKDRGRLAFRYRYIETKVVVREITWDEAFIYEDF